MGKTVGTGLFLVSVLVATAMLLAGCGGTGGEERSYIEVQGSDTMVNMGQNLAEYYMDEVNPEATFSVSGGGSGTGIAAIINDDVDIAQSSRAMTEKEIEDAQSGGMEGGLALGGTKWQTIKNLVLPNAVPGMATGSILALARAAGETAPIILTGAAFFLPHLPESLSDRFMALLYHLYILSTQHIQVEEARSIAYGTALVLMAMVMVLNLAAIMWRYRARKKAQI